MATNKTVLTFGSSSLDLLFIVSLDSYAFDATDRFNRTVFVLRRPTLDDEITVFFSVHERSGCICFIFTPYRLSLSKRFSSPSVGHQKPMNSTRKHLFLSKRKRQDFSVWKVELRSLHDRSVVLSPQRVQKDIISTIFRFIILLIASSCSCDVEWFILLLLFYRHQWRPNVLYVSLVWSLIR